MMDGAYFTSRNELLTFLNTLLDLNLTKIEQTASGAVACQLTEYIFPNSIPMSRVNWAAKSSHEYVANYKLLQSAFSKNKIQKYVDVDKLIRGKYQDNLEFCQWLKAFFDMTCSVGKREGYDAATVRAKGKGGKLVERSKGNGGAVGSSRATAGRAAAAPSALKSGASRVAGGVSSSRSTAATASGTAVSSNRPVSSSSASSRVSSSSASRVQNITNTVTASPSSAIASKPRKPSTSSVSSSASSAANAKLEAENARLKAQLAELQAKYTELEQTSAEIEMSLTDVEKERDFYFDKLRGIEIMLQVYKEKVEGDGEVADVGREASKVIGRVFRVMYATMDQPIDVDDEGNVSAVCFRMLVGC